MSNDILIDAFERIKKVVHGSVAGLSVDQLAQRPGKEANSIAWLVWHLTRVQDDHIADMAEREQVWMADEWRDKFNLPFREEETGYGQSSQEVAVVQASAELLTGYFDAVHEVTVEYLTSLKEADYKRIVDANWDPAVTLAIRLVSVIADDLQHAGQAAYVRGLLGL